MNRLSYKTLFLIIVFLLIPIVLLLKTKKANLISAAWWNNSWSYRQAININTHSVGETNVYITLSVNIGSTAKAQVDDGDFRFVNSTGEILPYYISSNAGTTNPTFHIFIANYPAGTQTFYVYYGNPSAPDGFSSSDFATAAGFTVAISGTEEVGGGPVVWYKFDEGVGSTIYNSNNNQTNGTFGNGTSAPNWADESQCISGKCLKFDGNDFVNLSQTNNLDLNQNFTIETWIKPNSLSGTWNTFFGGSTADIGFGYLGTGSTATVKVTKVNSADAGQATKTIPVNSWSHVSVTFNNTTKDLTYYINGTISNTVTFNQTFTNSTKHLGNTLGYASLINAFLDDFKVYPYVRTANQILLDYNTGISGQSSNQGSNSSFGSSTQKSLSDGLIGYWKFDEGIGTSVTDSSGTGTTGILGTGSSAPNWVGGKFGVGLSFSVNDYISMGDPASDILDFNTGDFSIAAWFKISSYSTWSSIVNKGGSGIGGYGLTISDTGMLSADIQATAGGSNQHVISATAPSLNNWHHGVAVYKRDGTIKVYLDGYLENESGYSSGNTGSISNSSNFLIGMYTNATAFPFNGAIDEVRVYNRALSTADVKSLFSFSPGPIAWWKLDESSWTNNCSTASILDSSGNNYNGKSCPNTTGPLGGSNGKFGNAGLFDYTNDFLSLPAVSFAPGQGSISAWVNMATIPAVGSYYSVVMRNYQEDGIDILNDTINGHVVAIFRAGGGACTSQYATSHYLAAGTWYHLSGTYDGQNMRLYVNGQLDNTCSRVGDWGDNTGFWGISSMHGADPSNRFYGKIDDVRLYNYVRTPEQIIQDMQGGSSTNPGLGKPIVYYKLDEGQGSTTNNSGYGGSLYSGTFGSGSSSPSWSSGINNKSLSFDGVNDYVTSGLDLDNSKAWSYSFWMKDNASVDGADEVINGGNHNPRVAFYTNKLQISYKNTAGTYFDAILAGPVITLGNWYHYSLTWDESKLVLYQNGIEVGRYTITDGMYNDTSNIVLGYRFGNPINGNLDDVKVYNYALSPDEVKSDYNLGSSTKIGKSTQTIGTTTTSLEYCIPGDTTACAAPVGEWKFEENVGTTTFDSSGNNNFGVFSAAAPTWTTGKIGSGLVFDGNNSQFTVSPSTSLNNLPANGMSVSAWIYPRSRGENNVAFIIAKNNGFNPSAGWYFRLASTYALNFSVDGSTDLVRITNDNVVVPNSWNHVEVSWDGVITTASSAHIYVNGIEVTYVTTTNGAARVDDASSNFYIGNDSGQVRTFDGTIDQVRAYNYARTPAQVAYDYNKGGPIGWWKFDECQGNVSKDSTGIGLTGSISIGTSGTQNSLGTCTVGTSAAWTAGASGKINSSLNFDGYDDVSTTVSSSGGILNPLNSISVSSWINIGSTKSGNSYIATKGWFDSYGLFINGSNQVRFEVVGPTSNSVVISTNSISTGSWYHLTATYDSQNIKLYINGVLNNSVGFTGSIAQNTQKFAIGNIPHVAVGTNYGNGFIGRIDDVRVYNYPLTSTQIQSLYNNGSVSFK